MKVLFLTANDDGASWYRADQPAAALQWSGHQTWATTVPVPSLLAKADVVVASRPARPEALKMLADGRERYGFKIVADLDDDYWSMSPDTHRVAYQEWFVKNDGELIDGLGQGCRMADLVTVASEGELEAVQRHAGISDVSVIPNGLHAAILGLPKDYENGFSNDGVLTIGWAGTASSMDGLELCAKALAKAAVTYRGKVRLRLVGFNPAAASPAILKPLDEAIQAGADVAFADWVPHGDQYLSAVAAFDLWVAPYRATPFNEAKFATKALEAGFWGTPLIASDIRPYYEWLARTHQADHPRLVSEYAPHGWSQQLRALIEDPALRRRYGEAARSAAVPYTLQEVGRRWEAVLSDLL